MKPVRFMGSAKDDLSAFPKSARTRAGYELFMVQVGRDPDDWKPMPTVGPGACEVRVRDQAGAFRVVDAVYVLHAFQKKSRKTSPSDLKLARQRYRDAEELTKGTSRG
jgi:phage-related protein